ncbi:TPA: SMI1/KNR4 family protein [Neisseria lactamica]
MKKLNIWRDEGKVSASIIEKFAENLGVAFPRSYIYLISEHDYLYPEEDCFIFIDNNKNTDDRNILFLGYKKDASCHENIYTYSCIDDEYGYGNQVVAFGISANGDYICFDYRKNSSNPSIVLMYHDEFYEDELGNTKMITVPIAPDFDSFIDKLYQDVD